MRTFVANDADGLADVLRAATTGDSVHTCFRQGASHPRLHVDAGRWALMCWASTDTNGRWRLVGGKVEHRPSPPDTCPHKEA